MEINELLIIPVQPSMSGYASVYRIFLDSFGQNLDKTRGASSIQLT